ncbi:MAG: hypothetical protein IT379_27940 [Deltaproteobacteria bacterium]|nr:hypothetical protein [Deltaproteobacteria bacterium]
MDATALAREIRPQFAGPFDAGGDPPAMTNIFEMPGKGGLRDAGEGRAALRAQRLAALGVGETRLELLASLAHQLRRAWHHIRALEGTR